MKATTHTRKESEFGMLPKLNRHKVGKAICELYSVRPLRVELGRTLHTLQASIAHLWIIFTS